MWISNDNKPGIPSTVTGDLGLAPSVHPDKRDGQISPGPSTIWYTRRSRRPSNPPSPIALSTQPSIHPTTFTVLPSGAATTSIDEGTVVDRDHSPRLSRATRRDVITAESAVDPLNPSASTHVKFPPDVGNSERRTQKYKNTGKNVKGNARRTLGEGDPDGAQGGRARSAQDAHIDLTHFRFEPNYLASLVHTRDFENLKKIGGIEGLLNGLHTDAVNGLSIDERTFGSGDTAYAGYIKHREVLYGLNALPMRKSKSMLESAWLMLTDTCFVNP